MALKGLRLAFASETDEGRKFSAAKCKWLTGGDTLTGRGLYDKHLISFTPTHLLVLLTNHKPNAPDTDFAFWERCSLIPHKLSFVVRGEDEAELKPHEREADKNLPAFLRANAGIILAWMVRGCLYWQKIGLSPPQSVLEATITYQEDENYLGQFIEAACSQHQEARDGSSDLYEAFCHWYKANINKKDKYLPSQKAFGQKLMAADLFERKRIGGCYQYIGIEVSDEYKMVMATAQPEDDQWKRG
jgi:putative DNA primase/helicase